MDLCGIDPGDGGGGHGQGGGGGHRHNLGSGSYNYAISVLHLPGRNGLDLDLALHYNSAVWSVDLVHSTANFNPDRDFPTYGFRLDFGYLEYDSGDGVYILSDATGGKHRLRAGTSPYYNSDDSTYIQYNSSSLLVTYKNGTQVTYAPWTPTATYPNLWSPVKIEDTNGNYISIAYGNANRISQITDTLGRVITYNYSPQSTLAGCPAAPNYLCSITMGSEPNPTTRYAKFAWGTKSFNYSFASGFTVSAPAKGTLLTVLTSCTYPNNTNYQFAWGDWGIISAISFQSATNNVRSSVNYNYPTATTTLTDTPNYTQETVFDGVNTNTWNYSVNKNASGLVTSSQVTDSAGTVTTTTLSANSDWKDGLPLSVVTQSGTTALKEVDNAWTADSTTNYNSRLSSFSTTLKDTGQQSQVLFLAYDPNGNATQVKEFDWGLVAKRYTTYSYASLANHILDHVSQIFVYDGNNNLISRTDYGYDSYPSPPGITGYSGTPSQHDATYSTSYTTRGNLTSTTRYSNAANISSGVTVARTSSYDIFGNIVSAQTDCCTSGSWTYTSNTQWSYPETVVRGTSPQLAKSFFYDFNTGYVIKATDENGQYVSFQYNDPNLRIRQIDRPDPSGRVQTNVNYDDNSTEGSISWSNTANSVVQKTTLDGNGRNVQQQQQQMVNGSPVAVTTVDMTYDDVNRKITTTNPYGPSDSKVSTVMQFDALGRLASVSPPSGGSYSYTPGGNTMTISDPVGHQRKIYSDALGRIVQVDEPGDSPTVTIGGSERSATVQTSAGTASAGWVTVSGDEGYNQITTCSKVNPDICHTSTTYDQGTLYVTVGGVQKSVGFGNANTTSSTLAGAIAGAFAGDGSSPVTANAPASTVYFTARANGPNYGFSTSRSGSLDFSLSQSGSSTTGGVYPVYQTAYDTGTVTVTVNGLSKSVGYGQGTTPNAIAQALSAAFSSDTNSPVLTSVAGSSIVLTNKDTGSGTAYSVTASCVTTNSNFTGCSFTATPPANGQDVDQGTPSLSSPNSTYYVYNPLNQLTTVTSGIQTRSFVYDSMGRLTQQTTPEEGTITYKYLDSSGNVCSPDPTSVCQRTEAARNITITYKYDALNRVTFDSGTTKVFNYDEGGAAANAMGRLTSTGDNGPFPSQFEALYYDVLGRLSQDNVMVGSGSSHYQTSYTYWPTGGLKTITYPSGRQVTYSYDNGTGRLNSIADATTTYLNVPTGGYWGSGLIHQMNYGSGVQGIFGYNDHLQMNSINYALGANTLLNLSYSYADPITSNNNGAIWSITDGRGLAYSTTYTYDALKRLNTAHTNDSPQSWGLSWSYDRYGNRWGQTVTGGSGPAPQVTIDASTNRILTSGFSYTDDSGYVAGNLTNDSAHKYSYDSYNRLTMLDYYPTTGAIAASYGYDSFGRRNQKNLYTNGSVTSATVYVYFGNQVLAEYSNGALSKEYVYQGGKLLAALGGSNTTYAYQDHLSTRVETDSVGNVTRTFGHLPFGETWYETGTDKWKFTAYERDAETNNRLDYAGFRNYSGIYGRFVQPDPAGLGAVALSNPQTWNRYSYALNMPCEAVDLLGLSTCTVNISIDTNGLLNDKQLQAMEKQIQGIYATADLGVAFVSQGADYALTVNAGIYAKDPRAVGTTTVTDGVVNNAGDVYIGSADAGGLLHAVAQGSAQAIQQYGQNSLALGIGLGRAGTHEIGHFLLPKNYDGGDNGNPMQSGFTSDYVIGNAGSSPWKFTADQATNLQATCQNLRKQGGGNGPGGGSDGNSGRNPGSQGGPSNCPIGEVCGDPFNNFPDFSGFPSGEGGVPDCLFGCSHE